MKSELIVYWKDDKKISLRAKINSMDIQGDNILCRTLDGGTILINSKLITYLRTYPLKDGK